MLEYAVKLTSDTCMMKEEDLIPLREAGYEDETILDIIQIISYFNFVNRLACGLGIELEDFYNFGE